MMHIIFGSLCTETLPGVCNQPIIVFYFESENELEFYNLEALFPV